VREVFRPDVLDRPLDEVASSLSGVVHSRHEADGVGGRSLELPDAVVDGAPADPAAIPSCVDEDAADKRAADKEFAVQLDALIGEACSVYLLHPLLSKRPHGEILVC